MEDLRDAIIGIPNMETQTIYLAFIKAQSEFKPLTKDGVNPHFKNKYASISTVLESVLPILHANNLYLTQAPISEGERIGVKTTITHALSGDSMESSFTVALAKNDPQGAGSALTYCKRYALISILGLSLDEDDDAEGASGNSTQETLPTIRR